MSPSKAVEIKIKNSATYKGRDRWEWSVWIEGPSERLDEIAYVDYILHPTFAQPLRHVEDRGSAFRLNSKGWGEFMIHANVAMHSGETQRLDHWLRLVDDSHSAGMRAADVEKPTLFVSYSRADTRIAEELCRFLEENKGYEILTDNQLNVDEPAARAIRSMIGRTDAVVALIPDELSSRWVMEEIGEAVQQQIPVIPVLLGKNADAPPSLADTQSLRLKDRRNSAEAIQLVTKALEQLNL
jgi:hypothetical protein